MSTTATVESAGEHEVTLSGENKLMKALLIAAIAASSLSMIFSFGTAVVSASQDSSSAVASVAHAQD